MWPFGVALRREASNRPSLRWLKTVVVNGRGKGAFDVSGGDREDERKLIAAEASLPSGGIETGEFYSSRDELGGCSAYWPSGVRRAGDVSPVCCVRVEQEKARMAAGRWWKAVERESPGGPDVLRRDVRVPRSCVPADRPVVVVKPW